MLVGDINLEFLYILFILFITKRKREPKFEFVSYSNLMTERVHGKMGHWMIYQWINPLHMDFIHTGKTNRTFWQRSMEHYFGKIHKDEYDKNM